MQNHHIIMTLKLNKAGVCNYIVLSKQAASSCLTVKLLNRCL